MMKKCLVVAAALGTAASCTPSAPPPKLQATSSPTVKATPPPAPPQPSQYVVRLPPRTNTTTRFELDKGRIGLIVRGSRWVVDSRGAPVVDKDDALALSRVQPIDAGAGGGYLFYGNGGIYQASQFDGELREVTPGSVSTAWVGPGFVLTMTSEGRTRVIDSSSNKPFDKLPLGTIVVRTGKDSTTAALTHGGRAHVSRDRGLTWTDVTASIGVPVDLEVSEGQLFIMNETGEATRVDQGQLVMASVPPKPRPPFDPEWTKNESPIEFVVARGVLLEEDRAVAVDGGTIVEVSLSSGKVVGREAGVLPPQGSCVPLALSQRVLFMCGGNDPPSVFSRAKRGGTTKLEKMFDSRGTFFRGTGDALMFAGPCKDGASAKAGMACVRGGSGDWFDVDRSADLSDAPPSDPLRVVTWVPKEEGAYLVVGGKNGGIWDAKSGSKSRLDEAQLKRLEDLFSSASGKVVDRAGVVEGGDIVGLGRDNVAFRVSDGGKKVERSPFRMNSLATSGALILGHDNSTNTIWQSSNYGLTYVEVDGPPDPSQRDTPRNCSTAGCVFNQWIRVGWEARTPVAKPPSRPQAPGVEPPKLRPHQLKCTIKGPASRKALKTVTDRVGFGAAQVKGDDTFIGLYPRGFSHPTWGNVESLSLRAGTTGKMIYASSFDPESRNRSQRIVYVDPFDPKGTVIQTSLKDAELFDTARALAATPPDFMSSDHRGTTLVPLSDPPSVVLVNGTGPMIWARGKDKPLALAIPEISGNTPVSAVQTGPDELALASAGYEGETVVRSLGRGRANDLFTIPKLPPLVDPPANPDALALGPDGKLGVIRMPTLAPPTKEDPALLLRPNAAPIALAPWSTLDVDGSPACENMTGHRAVLQLRNAWVTPGSALETWGREVPSFLRVRWSATQVCLEAIEVMAGFEEQPNMGVTFDSYMVARFGKEPSAGVVLVGEGAELREPRTCELVK